MAHLTINPSTRMLLENSEDIKSLITTEDDQKFYKAILKFEDFQVMNEKIWEVIKKYPPNDFLLGFIINLICKTIRS